MRLLFVLLLAVSVFAVPAFAAPVPKELKKATPSVNGQWKMTVFIANGKSVLPQIDEWSIDGEKIITGKITQKLTFRDADRPELRSYNGMPAVVNLVDDKLQLCYPIVSDTPLTSCAPGRGFCFFVFERVKDK